MSSCTVERGAYSMALASLSGRGVAAEINRWGLLFCLRIFRKSDSCLGRAHGDGLDVVALFLLTVVQMRARPIWIDHHMSQTERGLPGVTRVDVKLFPVD